jgi:mannan endo-1,4-beta-mannosidase
MKARRSVLFALFPLLFAFATTPAAEILSNGSFETNAGEGSLPTGWTRAGSGPNFSARVTGSAAQAGTWSVRVTGRAAETDGLRLNLLSALSNAGSGVRRWCRAYVRVDDFASVRVLLRYADAGGQHPDLVLAEQMVWATGAWVAVEGDSKITWNGALQSASLRIEVQQLSRASSAKPTDQLPDYSVDGLTLDDDADADGILDREEPSAGFNATRADTDGDGLPDRWELDHGLSPQANEASADPDGDGFSNWQEFWAATDPRAAGSYPGKPANPNANAATRDVLRWLALLPSQTTGRHLAVGQNISDLGSATEYPEQIDGLGAETGKFPAILSMAIEPPFDRFGIPLQIQAAESRALAYWQAGGIPLLKWAVYNPWTVKNAGDQTNVDIAGLLNPAASDASVRTRNQAAHDNLVDWMRQVGDALARLQQQGVVVMFRPMSEMNGAWFWWGHREYLDYASLWEFLFDYFTHTRGLNNLIWVYESASTEHAPSFVGAGSSASDYYYPGDDRVDAMCHNLYSGDWVLPWDGNRIHARYPKIYGIPQAGPDHANRTGAFDNLTYLRRSEAALPRSSFFIVWNSFDGADPVTGTQAYQKIAIVDNLNASALMNHASIVTRETVAFSQPATPVPPAPATPAAPAPSMPSTPTTPSSSGGGGGGAPSGWFLAALALTALIRLRRRGR